MKKVKFVLIIGLITTLGTVYAQQDESQMRERRARQEHRGQEQKGLELTDEQKTQAEALKLNMEKAALPIKNKLGENRAKMRTLTTAANADLKSINKLIDENAELRADLEKMRAANHQEFRKMLTEEQRIKFDSRPMRGNRQFQKGQRGQHGQRGQQRDFKGQ